MGKFSVLERPAKAGWAEAGRRRKAKIQNPDFLEKKFEFQPKGTAFGSLKQTYGVTKSASGFAKATLRFMYYVYSIKCKDGYYVGCTDNLKERLERHQKGYVPATANRLPVNLEFYFAVHDKYKAFEFEKYLKSGSGRAFVKKHLV